MRVLQSFAYLGVIVSLLEWPCSQGQVENCPTGKVTSVRCKSYLNAYLECYTNETSAIIGIGIKSFAPRSEECNLIPGLPPQDYPTDQPGIYGFKDYAVWVQNNCRATFEVCLSDECGIGTGTTCHENAKCVWEVDGSAKCRCNKGLYGNGVTECSGKCKCSATGDPHYTTFDGQMIHFQGNCTYTLVDAGDQDCGMTVNVKNVKSTKNPKVSLTEKVTVIVWSTSGNDTIVIDQGKKVSINGVRFNGAMKKDRYEIMLKGSYVIVENNCGMEAMFNGDTTAKVFIPKEDAAVAAGICGKCNGKQDDFRQKDGTDVSGLANKYSLIGQSYWVPTNDESETECLKDDEDIVCTEEVKQQIASNNYCGKIKDAAGPFKDCIAVLDNEQIQNVYYECEFDVCANWGSETDVTTQVCNAMSKFQSDCHEEQIRSINFRTADFCPVDCGTNMVYDHAINTVQPSCKTPDPPQVVSGPTVEGCKCTNGFINDDGKDQCVPQEECGCVDIYDNYFSIGDGYMTENCAVKTVCVHEDGMTTLKDQSSGCETNEKCTKVAPGIGVCVCIGNNADGVCEAPQGVCTGRTKNVRCKSFGHEYKECPMGEPSPITQVSIVFETEKSAGCKYHPGLVPEDYPKGEPGIYGFNDDVVWVKGSCKAVFEVCLSDECGIGTGAKCHEDANCVWGTDGSPECRCREGLYGDGITTCSKRCKCSATGDPHFKTFDGQMIHFQGVCTYTLVDAGKQECGMTVNVKNKRSPRNSKVSLVNKVIVIVKSSTSTDTIVIDQGRKVSINGVQYNGAVKKETFEIVLKGYNVIVKNKCGMEAMFNGDTTAKVFIPKEGAAIATGICGKCNDQQDDYRVKNGTDVSSFENKYSLIGQSYWTQGTNEDEVECRKEDNAVVCTDGVKQQIASNEYCGKIRDTSGPFKECITVLGEEQIQNVYYECEFDVCANWGSETDVTTQVCNAMAKLLGDCNDKQIENINFRTADFCPADCGANMVYDPLINTVQTSCKNPNPLQVVTGPAVEGCKCKDGFILDDGKDQCIPVEDCGCPVDDNYYPVGESFMDDQCTVKIECVHEGERTFLKDQPAGCDTNEVCKAVIPGIGVCDCADNFIRVNGVCEELCDGIRCHENAVCIRGEGFAQCRCNKGLYGNGVTGCTAQCKCSATGDPHYNTFDGQKIDFQGNCTYTMVDAGSQECGITVNVKNKRSTKNPKVSLTDKIIVIVKSTASTDTIVIDQGRKVSINGIHYNGGVRKDNFEIVLKGDNVIVENNCDMQALFNGETTAKVFIPKHHAKEASGICGKCNGIRDDYRQKDGTDVSGQVNKFSLIGQSYLVPGNNELETECLRVDETVTCTEEVKQRIASNAYCGKIRDTAGFFKECIEVLGLEYIEKVYNECEFDVCANWGSETDVIEQVCHAMSKLQGDCNEEPIGYVNFRTADFCPANCGDNMLYDPAINTVQPSCKKPNPPQVVNGPAVEGCKCKNGFLFDDGKDQCVREEDCGCVNADNYYPIGYNHLNEQCTIRTSCVHENGVRVFKSEASSCAVDEVCEVVSPGIGKCNCVDDYIRVNGICKASPECTGTQSKIRCKSYLDQYVECNTNEASPINKIWINVYAPRSAECNYVQGPVPKDYQPEEPGIYGFSDHFVWVHNNCRAQFNICLAE